MVVWRGKGYGGIPPPGVVYAAYDPPGGGEGGGSSVRLSSGRRSSGTVRVRGWQAGAEFLRGVLWFRDKFVSRCFFAALKTSC
jgi:hypothetical protein